MVQTVTLPLSELNAIPGVAGVQDVEFSIPELEDIVQAVVDNTLDRTDVDEAITEALGDLPDLELPDVPTAEEIADAVANQLDLSDLGGVTVDIEGSLFDIEQDLLVLIETVLRSLDLEDIFPDVDFTEVTDGLTLVQERLEELEVPTVEDIVEAVLEGMEELLEDLLPDWLLQPLEETVADLLNGLLEEAVDEDTKAKAREFGE